MDAFLFILVNIMFPLACIVGLGFLIQKKFHLDIRTLSRYTMYALVPCLVFSRVYQADFNWALLGQVFVFALIVMLALYGFGMGVAYLLRLPQSRRMAFGNSLMFFNSGNYGLPLVDLAFSGNPLAVTGQLLIMIIQNIVGNSLGVFQAGRGAGNTKLALKRTLSLPIIYVLALVFLIRAFGIVIPKPILMPIDYIANGFVGFALFTLGASLADIQAKFSIRDALISAFIKLGIAPILGLLLVNQFGFSGILAMSLVLGLSTPTAVNTAIIAREMENEPDYAAQMVFVSTLLSPISITILLLYMHLK